MSALELIALAANVPGLAFLALVLALNVACLRRQRQ